MTPSRILYPRATFLHATLFWGKFERNEKKNKRNIYTSSYASSIANDIAKEHDIDLKTINISHINAGIEINEISYLAKYYDNENTPIELKLFFNSFFKRNKLELIVKFLTNSANLLEILKIVISLPKYLLIKAVFEK